MYHQCFNGSSSIEAYCLISTSQVVDLALGSKKHSSVWGKG